MRFRSPPSGQARPAAELCAARPGVRREGASKVTESKLEERDTAALVVEAQAGDGQALTDLIAAHLPLVYNVVGRALNGHADTDDLVQETMVGVVRGLPALRRPERFRSWLVTIAYRQLQQHLRARRTAILHRQDQAAEVPDPSGDFAERTVSELMLTGQRREMAEAARWLDAGDRHLLALWWQEATGELTRAELAAALAVPPKHAAVRLQRMKSQLDIARGVVRALAARPRCADLADILRPWPGRAEPRWRKRLARHVRGCPRCGAHQRGLVTPEGLLLGLAALPLPVTLTETVHAAIEAKAAVAAQGMYFGKLAVAATAATVAAGGGFVYAVYETPAPPRAEAVIAAPSLTTRPLPTAGSTAVAAPTTAPAPSATPTRRPAGTGVTRADIYVAPGGSDAGDGSAARPFATLGKAVAAVRPGQTIALRGGTYRPTEPVTIATSGTAERRITLSNYRDERPVLDAAGIPADKWAVTQQASHWTVQGLEVRGSKSHAWVCRACAGTVFRRLSMHDNAESGLLLRDPGTTGNQVLDSDFFRNYDPAGGGSAGMGLGLRFGSGEGNVLRGNRAFGNADNGIDVGSFAGAVTLERNWAYGNGANRWNVPGWQSNANGFMLGGGPSPIPAAAHRLRDNAAWNNVHDGFADGGNTGAIELTNNTAYRNGAAGFTLPVAAATARANVSIGNASEIATGRAVASSGNTWDGGSWTAAMFRSSDAATAEGRRRADGSLPKTGFLATETGLGAAMG
jgi:RNA polymerase sigma factor (sigma-70 family)